MKTFLITLFGIATIITSCKREFPVDANVPGKERTGAFKSVKFSQSPGQYSSPIYLSFSCSDDSLRIMYSFDGAEPDFSSLGTLSFLIECNKSIFIDRSTIIKACYVDENKRQRGPITTGKFEIINPPNVPFVEFVPHPGTFHKPLYVKFKCPPDNSVVLYTLDDAEPSYATYGKSSFSIECNDSLFIDESKLIKARYYKIVEGANEGGGVSEGKYTIDCEMTSFIPLQVGNVSNYEAEYSYSVTGPTGGLVEIKGIESISISSVQSDSLVVFNTIFTGNRSETPNGGETTTKSTYKYEKEIKAKIVNRSLVLDNDNPYDSQDEYIFFQWLRLYGKKFLIIHCKDTYATGAGDPLDWETERKDGNYILNINRGLIEGVVRFFPIWGGFYVSYKLVD